jgi:hypothetical protein
MASSSLFVVLNSLRLSRSLAPASTASPSPVATAAPLRASV